MKAMNGKVIINFSILLPESIFIFALGKKKTVEEILFFFYLIVIMIFYIYINLSTHFIIIVARMFSMQTITF